MKHFNNITLRNASYLVSLFNKYGYGKYENLAILAIGNPKILNKKDVLQLGLILENLKQKEDPIIINDIIENVLTAL